ncbi:HAMP domain-containing sensor histidine kinase [Pseudonocardia sp.]|uniref:sensor histidine kinase n=1 Tax=Pseudonocardia sp. TaxID=60912 RepID=UPI002D8002FF|nr:HAMP domain-containing sensor histidine kinase [Pseudonocardia sp.]
MTSGDRNSGDRNSGDRNPGKPASRLRTVSLRRRVMLFSLIVLAVVLVLVSGLALVFTSIGTRADIAAALNTRAALADQLARQDVPPATIVERVRGPAVRVRLIDPNGVSYDSSGAGPNSSKPVRVDPNPPAPPGAAAHQGPGPYPAPNQHSNPNQHGNPNPYGGPGPRGGPGPYGGQGPFGGPGPVLRRTLADGSQLTLYGDSSELSAVQQRLTRLLVLLGLGGLGVAALALLATTRVALGPLDTMTALARSIAAGDRGRRLDPTRPNTELGRTAAAFDNMLDALEGAERQAKEAEATARGEAARTRQFVADAAHELRTPIAGLRAAAEAALSTRATGEERDRLHLLLIREAGRAGRLVEDLLALARIDAGLRLEHGEVELRGLADAEADRVRLLAPNLTVAVVGSPLTVPGDAQRMAQVLANLLDNARRYTPPGGEITITVDSQAASDSGVGPLARVRVADSGPGVPAADRERIFDRLVRLDDARGRDSGGFGRSGAGLGLAIARGIAHAHGGELRCDPDSVFELTLPIAP